MSNWSQVYGIKSNARRAARKAGCNPASARSTAGGYVFDLDTAGGSRAAQAKRAKAAKVVKTKAAKAAKAPKAGKTQTVKTPAGGRHVFSATIRPKAPQLATSADPIDKTATVIAMLRGPQGAAVADLCKATAWLPHTLRARISGIAKGLPKGETIARTRLMKVTFYRIDKAA